MKILWTASDELAGEVLVVRGRSTGGDSFRQVLDVGPSTLEVPSAGCWNLKMTVKRHTVSLRLQAFER
jgi:hypothetical protein